MSGRHSSVVSSAPTILRPRVRIPSTPSMLFQFVLKLLQEKNENKQKRGRDWPIFKNVWSNNFLLNLHLLISYPWAFGGPQPNVDRCSVTYLTWNLKSFTLNSTLACHRFLKAHSQKCRFRSGQLHFHKEIGIFLSLHWHSVLLKMQTAVASVNQPLEGKLF